MLKQSLFIGVALGFGYHEGPPEVCVLPGATFGLMAFPEPITSIPAEMMPIGTHTAHICEATDATNSTVVPMDGQSGDTDYPFGDIKVLATVGEYNSETGYMLVGVPDGIGAMLLDDETVRIVFQSESYGPILNYESYPVIVNDNGASFTGSHIMYVDYDRQMLSEFMDHDDSAAAMVKGSGEMVFAAYNLHGQLIGDRPQQGCADAPHFSNTDADGCGEWNYIMNSNEPANGVDWLMQSLCSAHLEEAHQWGAGLGVENDLFITNEEWTSFVAGSNFTGLGVHVVDLANYVLYATGVFTLGGMEKIVEVNCGHPDYVCFSPSGYNGAFGVSSPLRQGTRPDGTSYVWPQDIVPARLYVGKKGVNAAGEASDHFLARNGLMYGQLYGFAQNYTSLSRDHWHKAENRTNGDYVEGGFYPIDWRWDGQVKPFTQDGSWFFQHLTYDGLEFWNGQGRDTSGFKAEHNTPDPYGNPRFMQGSTAGYFGIYDFTGVTALLDGDGFPSMIPAVYTCLQGETDITAQVELGGKGQYANGANASYNHDRGQEPGEGKVTFEDVDGLEWIASSESDYGYLVIQEDSGNDFGERMFITPIQLDAPLTYYFVAMSGGPANTRNGVYNVGVPAKTNVQGGNHEFSGIVDLSGMLAKNPTTGAFMAMAGNGYSKRTAEQMVSINDKTIVLNLQAHNLNSGVIATFNGDRGGQVYAFEPELPLY